MTPADPAQPLKDFKPQAGFFLGIDSDGCAFGTMGIEHRECFCPWMIGDAPDDLKAAKANNALF